MGGRDSQRDTREKRKEKHMANLKFAVVQFDRHSARQSGHVGTLTPVRADGFYASADDAGDVAELMASDRPELLTVIVEVVAEVIA